MINPIEIPIGNTRISQIPFPPANFNKISIGIPITAKYDIRSGLEVNAKIVNLFYL